MAREKDKGGGHPILASSLAVAISLTFCDMKTGPRDVHPDQDRVTSTQSETPKATLEPSA